MENENNNGFGTENEQNPADQPQNYYGQNSINQNQGGYSQNGINQSQGGYSQNGINQNQGGYSQNGMNQNQGGYGQSRTGQTQGYYSQNGYYGQTGQSTGGNQGGYGGQGNTQYGQTNYGQQNNYGQQANYGQQNNYGQPTNYSQQNNYGSQNTYGGQSYQYGQNNYGGQNYTAYGYQNMAGGGAPLDDQGRPLKNNYGMKLTFSILEIISCNLISLICGIIGCINTTKANAAYHEGRWEDFKSSAKSATVSLWIGLVGVILQIVVVAAIVVMGFALEDYIDYGGSSYPYEYGSSSGEDYSKDYDDFDPDTKNDSEDSDYEFVFPASTFINDTQKVQLGGVELSFPMTYNDLTKAGYRMQEYDTESKISSMDYDLFSLYDADNTEIGWVYIVNFNDVPINSEDGVVFGIDIEYYSMEERLELVLPNGVTSASTMEEAKAVFGEPDEENTNSYGYAGYVWYHKTEGEDDTWLNSVEVYGDADGNIMEIDFYYMGED